MVRWVGLWVLISINPMLVYAVEQPAQAAANAQPQAEPTGKESPQSAAPKAEAEAQNEPESTFDLLELRVKGNTMLENTVIERTVYPYLGPKKTLDAVVEAQKALEEIYRNKGYQTVTVDIPEQDVENGVVYLQVVEGKISRLRVTDSGYFSLGKIKAGVPEAAEGTVPNILVLQKQVEELSNQSADRKITPILRAGDTPGTLEVDLKVKDSSPLHGRLELNGRNTSSTNLLRLVSSLHYDNLWQRLHSASLMYQVSPENSQEVDVWAGTYAMPIFNTDAMLSFSAISSSSNAQVASAGALSVVGIGEIYSLRLLKPLGSLDNYSHSLTLGVSYKNFQENINLIGSDNPQSTPINYLPFLAQYNSTLTTKRGQASFYAGVNFHVRGLFDEVVEFDKADDGTLTPQTQFELKRSASRSNYAYLNLGANFSHELPYGMEFNSRLAGQISDSPLISNEQFSMGGMQSIRGYFETQVLVDDGFTGSLELRSPHLAPLKMDYINKLIGLVFVDGGYGSIQQALGGTQNSYSLASIGLGLRFQIWKYFSGIVDLGFPLIDANPVKAGDPKAHFSIASEF